MNDERQRYAIHAAVFAALSPTLLGTSSCITSATRPRTPSELAELLEVSRPNVSQHLAILQRDGLVRRTRQDGRVLWEVVDPRLAEACALIDEILGPELALRAHALTQEA